MVRVKEQILVCVCGFLVYSTVKASVLFSVYTTVQKGQAVIPDSWRSGDTHVGWQVTLLMSPFFRGYSTTGLERFSASASWHEISAVTSCWEGGFHKKFCWHLQVSTSITQQTSAKSFHWIAFQCHLFCLLYLLLHFNFFSLAYLLSLLLFPYDYFLPYFDDGNIVFCSLSSLFWLTLGGHGSAATIDNTDKYV